MISLSTERLNLRPFNEKDLQNFIDLDQDPEVMRYISGGQITPLDEIQKFLPKLLERQTRWPVYGSWMADLKTTGESIGWFTLKPMPEFNNEFEVGYRLKRKFWGQGFATEGTKYLLNYGFEKLNLESIIGVTDPENKASQHVLKKSGLLQTSDIRNPWDPEGKKNLSKFEIKKI